MKALDLFEKAVGTLKEFVLENTTLSVHINVESYPLKITFFKEIEQLNFLDNEEKSGDGALLQFIFYDKMHIKTQEDFSVSEEIFNKLKSLSKEVNRLFLIAFFEKSASISEKFMKDFDKCEGIDKIGDSKINYRGQEYYLAIIRPAEIINHFVKIAKIEVENEC